MLRALPRDSATRHAVIGEQNDWSRGDHFLALIFDAVQAWGWAQLGSKKIPPPQPLPRPGDAPRVYRTELPGPEIERRLRAQLSRHRG